MRLVTSSAFASVKVIVPVKTVSLSSLKTLLVPETVKSLMESFFASADPLTMPPPVMFIVVTKLLPVMFHVPPLASSSTRPSAWVPI